MLPSNTLVLNHEYAASDESIVALPTTHTVRSSDVTGYMHTPLKRAVQPLNQKDTLSALLPYNVSVDGFYIEVEVGTPPQKNSMILDTGSSDIWMYAPTVSSNFTSTFFDPSKSSTFMREDSLPIFNATYGSAAATVGFYATDTVCVNGVQATNVTFAIVDQPGLGDPPGGIFGIGLRQNEASDAKDKKLTNITYPGFIDHLVEQGIIEVRAFSLYLNKQNFENNTDGGITWGGYDPNRYEGDLVPFDIVFTPEAPFSLTVPLANITMTNSDGTEVTLLTPNATVGYTPAVLDSGTSLQILPDSVLTILNTTLQNSLVMNGETFVTECSQVPKAGGFTYGFNAPNATLDQSIFVSYDDIFTIINDNGSPDPNGSICMLGAQFLPESVGAILGDTFLSSAYVLYNFDESTISIAQAVFGDSSDTSGTIALTKQQAWTDAEVEARMY